jgi:GlpG protein
MRQAGVIDDLKRAQRFADYLLARGIKSRVEPQPTGGKLWIYEDGQLEQARQELAEFNADPDNARYDRQREAQALREQERREQELAKQRMINVRTTWGKRGRPGSAPVSVTLIIVCIALHLLLHYGPATPGLRQFFNSLTFALAPGLLLQHLLAGEVWRLVTPVLLHGSLLHLGFNMLWLYSLGSQVETGRGTLRFLALVLAFSVVSNLTQYLWAGPNFLGMSGVVYGLFAYVWMQSVDRQEQRHRAHGMVGPVHDGALGPNRQRCAHWWTGCWSRSRFRPVPARQAEAIGRAGCATSGR